MLKNSITEARVRNLQRVEDWIADHPDCTAGDIGLALGFKRSTLSTYTQSLRNMGRVVQIVRSRVGTYKQTPADHFRVVPDLPPLSAASPIPAIKKAAPATATATAQRDVFVAALFGPAETVTS